MPSRILVPSLTAPSVSLGTHNPSTPHRAYHEKPSALHHRWSMFGYLNGLRKGIASLKKNQLKSEPVHRRVSSTISLFGPTPVPDLTPNNSSFVFSPPSPTLATPASVSCGVDASIPWITVSNAEVRRVPFPSLKNQSPVISFAPDAENFSKPPKQQVSVSGCSKPSSVAAAPPPVRVLRPQLDAATRLQDFRALITEMRATLLNCDAKNETEVGERDEEEMERLLWLLEDVMRKVKGLTEQEVSVARSVTVMHETP